MKYLILAIKNNINGGYDAVIIKENELYFNLMVEKTADLPVATPNNVGEPKVRIIFNDSEYNEDTNGVRWVVRRYLGFRKCDICGEWITPQDVRNGVSTWDGEKRKCALCSAKENEQRLRLAQYHDTSDLVRVINGVGENFTLRNVLGIGFEAEYYHGTYHDETIKCSKAFYDLANDNSRNRMFRCEQDGSVSGEIISNIFTKKSLYDFDCSIITDMLKLNGNIENNNKAGLHVHLSKLWLGTDPKEQCLNFLKLQFFLKSYENDFLKMSGRNREDMYYCQFFSFGEIERMKRDILNENDPWDDMPCSHGGCGCALNASDNTIEYRIGKNTNDPERMKHYLRFILGMVENIKNVPFSKCYCIGKVTRLVPAETMNYWRKQGCFLSTNALENRGVTL